MVQIATSERDLYSSRILIMDFGSQYTQLIARRVRELNVYSEIIPWHAFDGVAPDISGVILSGSPFSVRDENAPRPDLSKLLGAVPVLGVCYGVAYVVSYMVPLRGALVVPFGCCLEGSLGVFLVL